MKTFNLFVKTNTYNIAPQLSILLGTRSFWNDLILFSPDILSLLPKESIPPSTFSSLSSNTDTNNNNNSNSNNNNNNNKETEEEKKKKMEDFIIFLKKYSLTPYPTQVPKFGPISRAQYDQWTPVWPLIYRTHL